MNNDNTYAAMERAQAALLRWRILRAAEVQRPHAITDALLETLMRDIKENVCVSDIRREMDYLELRELVTVKKGQLDADAWACLLTREGVDVVTYLVECEPGIDRPRK